MISSVFHFADSDVTVSLVAPFVWLPLLGRKCEIILATLSTIIF